MSKKNDSEDSDEVEFIELDTDAKKTSKNKLLKNKNAKTQEYSMCSRKVNSVTSRRKTVHKVINENDEIMFESYPKLTDLSRTSSDRKTKKMPKLTPCGGVENDKKGSLALNQMKNIKKDATHPGIEHMHRIAFLKACINYMLIAVGKEPMDFEQVGITLSKLVNKYNGITPAEDEVIGISD